MQEGVYKGSHNGHRGALAFFGLGWVRFETLIVIKKVLFIHTLIRMADTNVLKILFKARVMDYLKDRNKGETNTFKSPVFGMLNACKTLGVLDNVLNMISSNFLSYGKKSWSKLAWERGWEIDDAYWRSASVVFRTNDLLYETITKAQYLIWWLIADNCPSMQRVCETMAKLICRTSLLKADDFRLKDSPVGARLCQNCVLGIEKSLFHVVMQCPSGEVARASMFDSVEKVVYDFRSRALNAPHDTFPWLLGKVMEGVVDEQAFKMLEITGNSICSMYNRVISTRVGIG